MASILPSKLSIRNFRGIPKLELDFVPNSPCYLIGPNNAGKSTILNATALLFRSGGFHSFTPEKFDFFHDSKGTMQSEFSVSLQLSSKQSLPTVHTLGKVHEVQTLEVKGNYYKTSARMEHSHRLLDDQQKAITLPIEMTLSKQDAQKHSESDHGYKVRNARLDDIRDFLPEVWLLNSSNLGSSLYSWKTGPLNRLAKILSEKFFEEKWEFDFGGQKRKMPDGIIQAHKFFTSAIKEFPYWKEVLKPKLEESLSTYLGTKTFIELNPLIQSVEEWLRQQLLLSFAAQAGQALTPLDRMGDGYQSLVRLSALEVLSTIEDQMNESVMLLYEEPETYLHPHLRRKLRNIFDRLSKKGWHLICATHSQEFISFERTQSINRIIRDGDHLHHGRILTTKLPDSLKLQEKIDEAGNHEIFFAQKVILCEGKDDLFAIKSYLEKSGIDLETTSISVLSCGSVGNIADFAQIASDLFIPFCTVTDMDMQADGTIKKNTQDARDKIKKLISTKDVSIIWDNTLEDCLNTLFNNGVRQKARPDWQRSNIFTKDLKTIDADCPKLKSTFDSIITWLHDT